MKNKILIVGGLSLVLILSLIVGIILFNKDNDSLKFKKEYESINNDTINGNKVRKLNINKNNKVIYLTPKELLDKINNKESFVVYFGFKECPWCRSILESLIEVSNDSKVDNLYYVDVKDIRDVYEAKNNETKLVKEGTKEYYELLKKMDKVLSNYDLKDSNIDEKRIYAPNVVSFVEGESIKLETGINPKETNPYMEITKEMKDYTKNTFKCLFKCVEDSIGVCEKDKMC